MQWLPAFLMFTFFFVRTQTLDYSDLETLGVSCRPRDTCASNIVRTFSSTNCECDSWCHSFDDCCVNGLPSRSHNGTERRPGITCLPLENTQGVYAVANCASAWNESDDVRSKCEGHDDFSDPFASLPATDTHTNVTYRNRYCAECNSASLGNISSWDLELTCSSLEETDRNFHNISQNYILQNIVRVGSSWGVYHWNESLRGMGFYPCELSPHLPDNLRYRNRFCRPYVISTCSPSWTRRSIRNKCFRYMAVIYIENQAYRNAHCALCNNVSLTNNRTCIPPGILTRSKTPSLSFTLLLDVNPSDGDQVGESNPCSSDEKYDPFFKKCRALVCVPPGNRVFRNGRCVPS